MPIYDGAGSVVGLRSKRLGVEVPVPGRRSGYGRFADCFAPDRARRLWAIAREIETAIVNSTDGRRRVALPGRGLDAGNYRSGHSASFGSMMLAAQELRYRRSPEAVPAQSRPRLRLEHRGGVSAMWKRMNFGECRCRNGANNARWQLPPFLHRRASTSTFAGPILADKYPEEVLEWRAPIATVMALILCSIRLQVPVRIGLSWHGLSRGRFIRLTAQQLMALFASNDGTADLYANIHGRADLTVREKR